MARMTTMIGQSAAGLMLALGLSGCMDTLEANNGRRPVVSAPSVPVALVSVDGVPQPVSDRFEAALNTEAKRRQIVLVHGSESPRYKLKGYLSAYEVEGGTALTWVWDMYDSTDEKRTRRVDGSQLVKTASAEPWSSVNDAALQAAAASSMNEVASYLANPDAPAVVPQQVAVASTTRLAAVSPAQDAHPPRASNRPQPEPLPSVNAFAATFDLQPSGRSGASPVLGLKSQSQ